MCSGQTMDHPPYEEQASRARSARVVQPRAWTVRAVWEASVTIMNAGELTDEQLRDIAIEHFLEGIDIKEFTRGAEATEVDPDDWDPVIETKPDGSWTYVHDEDLPF